MGKREKERNLKINSEPQVFSLFLQWCWRATAEAWMYVVSISRQLQPSCVYQEGKTDSLGLRNHQHALPLIADRSGRDVTRKDHLTKKGCGRILTIFFVFLSLKKNLNKLRCGWSYEGSYGTEIWNQKWLERNVSSYVARAASFESLEEAKKKKVSFQKQSFSLIPSIIIQPVGLD